MALSQMTNGGYYCDGSLDDIIVSDPLYYILILDAENDVVVSTISLNKQYCKDLGSEFYALKYDNYEPAIQYCDQLFGVEPVQ